MFWTVSDRMERHIFRQRLDGLAVDLDFNDRVHEVTSAKLADQFFCLDVDHRGFFFSAVDYSGYTAVATQCTGGSLASPFARFCR